MSRTAQIFDVNKPKLWRYTLLSLSILSAACSGCRTTRPILSVDEAPGFITIDILEGGQPEHYWLYQLQPSAGDLHLIKQRTFPDYKHEDMSVAAARSAISPDGNYLACFVRRTQEFDIKDAFSGETRFHWNIWRRDIQGFAWSPNSNSVAILTTTNWPGINPLEFLALFAGHPVAHNTIYLTIVDYKRGDQAEYLIRRNIVSAYTRILAWSR